MTGGFLDRWSRRKRAAGTEATEAEADAARAATTPPADEAPAAAAPPEPETDEADAALLASLPPVEEITAGTDIRVFLQKGVPASLRNAALRRAWSADPLIAGYEDPARDYFWDWNAPGGVPGGGGALDPDRVAKMVRDIVGKDESAMQDSAGETDESPAAPMAETRPEEPEAAPPVPGHESVNVGPDGGLPAPAEPPARAAARADQEKTACDALPRRRHGGAMPG